MFSVKLDAFCGPVDLLLYLVRKRELDVFDIPIAEVTDQFLLFIDALDMDKVRLLASHMRGRVTVSAAVKPHIAIRVGAKEDRLSVLTRVFDCMDGKDA